MTRQAQVGAFAILAMLLLFGIFYVITDFGTRHTGYKMGVHFESAAGLHSGALVYFSGVTVGTVDSITLLPDNTVDVILAIENTVDIPSASKFLIQAPLTGDPNLLIVPPLPRPGEPLGPVLERRVLPVAEQPQGKNSATIADLLQEGQGEVRRLDALMVDLERREPKLMDTLQQTLSNANQLTQTLQTSLSSASANFNTLSGTLTDTATLDSKRIDVILVQLESTSVALNRSMDSLSSLATNPNLNSNLLATTKNIAETTETIAELTKDLRTITSDPQTQAQLKDTIANADATIQRANSLLGTLGGRSNVYGVDASATPYPLPAVGSTPYPLPGSAQGAPGKPPAAASPSRAQLEGKLASIARNLVAIQVRMSGRHAQSRCCRNPLIGADRGPQIDVTALIMPHGSTTFMLGANDIGYNTTWNAAVLSSVGSRARIGAGVLYSRLGVLGQYREGALGLETRLYDPRYPMLDIYGNVRLAPGTRLFFGQRDLTHAERRTIYGIQLQF